jgi:hypothetical protein
MCEVIQQEAGATLRGSLQEALSGHYLNEQALSAHYQCQFAGNLFPARRLIPVLILGLVSSKIADTARPEDTLARNPSLRMHTTDFNEELVID